MAEIAFNFIDNGWNFDGALAHLHGYGITVEDNFERNAFRRTKFKIRRRAYAFTVDPTDGRRVSGRAAWRFATDQDAELFVYMEAADGNQNAKAALEIITSTQSFSYVMTGARPSDVPGEGTRRRRHGSVP